MIFDINWSHTVEKNLRKWCLGFSSWGNSRHQILHSHIWLQTRFVTYLAFNRLLTLAKRNILEKQFGEMYFRKNLQPNVFLHLHLNVKKLSDRGLRLFQAEHFPIDATLVSEIWKEPDAFLVWLVGARLGKIATVAAELNDSQANECCLCTS